MRGLKAFPTLAAVVAATTVVACSNHDDRYAPATQPDPEPRPPASDVPSAPDAQAHTDSSMPQAPIPYDQLDGQGASAAGGDKPPPKAKSNDKAVFY
jgi:hypothetical protein